MLQRKRSNTNPTSPHWPSEMGGLGGSSGDLGCQLTGRGLLGCVLIGASSKDGVQSCGKFQHGIGKKGDAVNQWQIRKSRLEPSKQFTGRAAAGRAVVDAEVEKREVGGVKEFGQRGGCCWIRGVLGIADELDKG